MDTKNIQKQIALWVRTRLGDDAMHPCERGRRSVEENLELEQALGVSREEAHRLVDHVFDKPVGEVSQEFGGSALTLLVAAESMGVDLGNVADNELYRIYSLPMEKFRKRQAENVVNGIGS